MKGLRVKRIKGLRGKTKVPGDKSIAHRAAMLSSISSGDVRISNYPRGEDNLSTISAIKALGVEVEFGDGDVFVRGKGPYSLKEPADVLYLGNSGTTFRLISGILSAQPFFSVLTGDDSLRSRPMERIIEPLTLMGAEVIGRANNRYPPIAIKGGRLKGISYNLKVASAQVKSAILLAGLYADGRTEVIEPKKSRDHTERMLKYLDVPLDIDENKISIEGGVYPKAKNLFVPGDISSAAFLIVAALITDDSEIVIEDVGLNPTRAGFIDVLLEMGANIEVRKKGLVCNEPFGDIKVSSSRLSSTDIRGGIIPKVIDEIPILAVAACFAEGKTEIRDARELRVKESDRIASLATELPKLGAKVEEHPDGLTIYGKGSLKGASSIFSYGDHRICMALYVACLASFGESFIYDVECVKVSYPEFFETIDRLKV